MALDGKSHDVRLYVDATAEFVVNKPTEEQVRHFCCPLSLMIYSRLGGMAASEPAWIPSAADWEPGAKGTGPEGRSRRDQLGLPLFGRC